MTDETPKPSSEAEPPLEPNVEFTKATIEIRPEFKRLRDVTSPPFPTCIIECDDWEDFVQLLQEWTSGFTSRASPTMPICVSKNAKVFTAMASLSYPTILAWEFKDWKLDTIENKITFLRDCGYAIVKGTLGLAI